MSGGANTNNLKAKIEGLWAGGNHSVQSIARRVDCSLEVTNEVIRRFRRHSNATLPFPLNDDEKHLIMVKKALKGEGFPFFPKVPI